MDVSSVDMSGLMSQQMATTQLQKDDSDTSSFEAALNTAMQTKDKKALMDGCKSFESYFVQMMFREMRKTTSIDDQDGILPDSQATQTFQDMLDEQYAENISNGQGIGLADMMYNQMVQEMDSQATV